MIKELPKVLSIYDLDIPLPLAKAHIKSHFTQNSDVTDPRVTTMLVNKGYMELEETLMQWKQKAQLMRGFEEGPLAMQLKDEIDGGDDDDRMMNDFFRGEDMKTT